MKLVLVILLLAGCVSALDMTQLNSVGSLMEQETSKFSVFLTGFESQYEKWNDVYELITHNDEY